MINVLIVGWEGGYRNSRIPPLSTDQPALEYQSFTSHLLMTQHSSHSSQASGLEEYISFLGGFIYYFSHGGGIIQPGLEFSRLFFFTPSPFDWIYYGNKSNQKQLATSFI